MNDIKVEKQFDWIKELPASISVCDKFGTILLMNDRAVETFKDLGGSRLIGTPILDCHPEPARSQLEEMMQSRKENTYTTEKNGVKKMVFQTPWYKAGEYAGFVELAFQIPFDMPHFLR